MIMTTERRNFLKGVSAAAASTAVLAGTQTLAQGNLQTGTKAMPYQAKPMAVTAPLGILVRMQPIRLAAIGFLNIVPA
jgi:hypothetical protein